MKASLVKTVQQSTHFKSVALAREKDRLQLLVKSVEARNKRDMIMGIDGYAHQLRNQMSFIPQAVDNKQSTTGR